MRMMLKMLERYMLCMVMSPIPIFNAFRPKKDGVIWKSFLKCNVLERFLKALQCILPTNPGPRSASVN